MTWPALFGVFMLSHLVGDFLFQTDWQAHNKARGLVANGEARRALLKHGLVYTLVFVPSLVWIGVELDVWAALGVGALLLITHVVVDDGTLVAGWVRSVKHVHEAPSLVVRLGVDQTVHVLVLAALALLVTA